MELAFSRQEAIKRLEFELSLAEKYPGLKELKVGEQNYFVSKSINSIAEEVNIDTKHAYFTESVVRVWPFVREKTYSIFSDPPFFIIAVVDSDISIVPDPNWKELLIGANINQKVIDSVQEYLDEKVFLR